VVDKEPRKVEQTRKPRDHADDVQGFQPEIHDARRSSSYEQELY
jgi:hypothetical protein